MAATATVTYFKRFRMVFDLQRELPPPIVLPEGYRLIPWDRSLVSAHATAKYNSFRTELDANVFPCLGSYQGCRRLMNELARKSNFVPEATWLVECKATAEAAAELCGTIQGLHEPEFCGAIQNVGVVPRHRGKGLGWALLHATARGFQSLGMRSVSLEVTAQNLGAIRLYRRFGFESVSTVYKAGEVSV